MGPGLKVAHRGVLWAASAEAPALTTPPGTLGIEFDIPGYKHQIWNLGTAFTQEGGKEERKGGRAVRKKGKES